MVCIAFLAYITPTTLKAMKLAEFPLSTSAAEGLVFKEHPAR
jgi:hypothetical protein